MRLWILFGCGVLILGAAIWPFGKRSEQLAPAPVSPAVAAKPTTPEVPKPEPAKVVEVIDLARAYEPVPEPEEPAGSVNPAAFIEVPEAPRQIPPASDVDNPSAEFIPRIQDGPLMWNGKRVDRIDLIPWAISPVRPSAEQVMVMPREVATIQAGLLNFVPTSPTSGEPTPTGTGELVFTPMCVPYATGVTQTIPPGASIAPSAEVLSVMPREVK